MNILFCYCCWVFFPLNLATLPLDTSVIQNENRSARYHFTDSNMEALEIM